MKTVLSILSSPASWTMCAFILWLISLPSFLFQGYYFNAYLVAFMLGVAGALSVAEGNISYALFSVLLALSITCLPLMF